MCYPNVKLITFFVNSSKYLGGHGDLLGGSMCTKDPELYLFLTEYQRQIGNTMVNKIVVAILTSNDNAEQLLGI